MEIDEVKGNTVRVNMTLKAGARHCLYGYWASDDDNQEQIGIEKLPQIDSSIEADGFLRLLPKYQQPPAPWQLFGRSNSLWFVQCYDARYMSSLLPEIAFVMRTSYTEKLISTYNVLQRLLIEDEVSFLINLP